MGNNRKTKFNKKKKKYYYYYSKHLKAVRIKIDETNFYFRSETW